MSMWFQVAAANNGDAITDATFSASFNNYGSGFYWVNLGPNQDFWCKAPGYSTCYSNTSTPDTGSGGFYAAQNDYYVKLAYTGAWPQTY